MNRNLVISIVGDESVHRTWLAGTEPRSFDLCLVYFGDRWDQWAGDGQYYLRRKGIKYQLLYDLFQDELAHLVEEYDRFWLPDDDVAADTGTVNRLFALAAKHRLQICQPAIGRGDVSFEATRAHAGYTLRYTRFVEIMCPLFTRKALVRAMPLFAANKSAWGIDWVWSSLFREDEVGIVDAAAVHHTRPLKAGGVHARLQSMGVDPGAEHAALMQQYGIRNRRFHRRIVRDTARLRGLDVAGNEVWTCSRWQDWFGRKAA
ncbi:MAG: hypothetical protein KF688_16750 [Pirellulales bacterium]|nr:hypothetical protein [Pirellulales bacterium]